MDLKTFIFIGRSGCGKGTQAKLLIDEIKKRDSAHEVFYLESGEKFRELLRGNNFTARLARDIGDKGLLQPAFLAIHVWSHLFIENIKGNEHLIVDGTPGKLSEARILADALRFYKRSQPVALNINVSRDWATERLLRSEERRVGKEGRSRWSP